MTTENAANGFAGLREGRRTAYQATAVLARRMFLEDPARSTRSVLRMLHDEGLGIARSKLHQIRKEALGAKKVPEPPRRSAKAEAASSPGERRKWLEDWTLAHPGARIREARAALKEKFGVSVGTEAIADAVRHGKSLAKAQEPEVQGAGARDVREVQELIEMAKRLGVKRIEFFSAARPAVLD